MPLRPVAAGEGVRVLLVDEDSDWRAGLASYLRAEGFGVRVADDPLEADAALEETAVDLVLLQAARAGSAGLNLCRRLAAQDGPAVILVSDGAQEIDRIVGLEVGADDFISQPCSQRELLARVRAVLRRRSRGGAAAAGADAAPVRFAGWTLWPGKLEVQSPGGARSLLTASDFRLLCLLLERPRQPITREQLAQLLGGAAPNLRSLDTSVSRLRRKLGSSSTGEPLIRTLHGVGYMLNCAVERGAADLARAALA